MFVRVFFRTLGHGNSKIKIRQRNRWRKQAENSENTQGEVGTKKISSDSKTIAWFYTVLLESLLLEVVDELPSEPNLHHPCSFYLRINGIPPVRTGGVVTGIKLFGSLYPGLVLSALSTSLLAQLTLHHHATGELILHHHVTGDVRAGA